MTNTRTPPPPPLHREPIEADIVAASEVERASWLSNDHPTVQAFVRHRLAFSTPAASDAEGITDAADLLDRYASFIRTVKADDLELHPYLPEVERVAEALRAGRGWKPIESAPKDGTWIITAGGGADFGMPMKWCERVGAWECDALMLEDWDNQAEGYSRPTHWMPLPATPTFLPRSPASPP